MTAAHDIKTAFEKLEAIARGSTTYEDDKYLCSEIQSHAVALIQSIASGHGVDAASLDTFKDMQSDMLDDLFYDTDCFEEGSDPRDEAAEAAYAMGGV